MNEAQTSELNEILQIRRQKLDEFRQLGVEPFGVHFKPTHHAKEVLIKYGDFTKEELEAKSEGVIIAGRLMAKRGQGKAGFAHVQDL